MPALSGNELLLKLSPLADENYVSVAGIRTREISLGNRTVDVTHTGSAGKWRELLPDGGLKTASISGSGVFIDEATDENVRNLFMNGTIANWKIIIPSFGEFTGLFQISSLSYSARHDAEITFSIRLDSSGELSFTVS